MKYLAVCSALCSLLKDLLKSDVYRVVILNGWQEALRAKTSEEFTEKATELFSAVVEE